MKLDESILQTKTASHLIDIIRCIHKPEEQTAELNLSIRRVFKEQHKAHERMDDYQHRGLVNQSRIKQSRRDDAKPNQNI